MRAMTNGHSNGNGAAHSSVDRLPPQNIEVEQMLLGALLLDPLAHLGVAPLLSASDFYRDSHETIYRAILRLVDDGKPVDLYLLVEELKRSEDLVKVGGLDGLLELANRAPHSANAVYHAHIVREKAVRRRMIEAATQILRDAYADLLTCDQLTDLAETLIFRVAERPSGCQAVALQDVLVEAMERITARREGRIFGVRTDFRDLDERLGGGFQRQELVILAGRPSQGKTALALGIAEHVGVGQGLPVLFVSLEMGKAELGERLLASGARIDGVKLKLARVLSAREMEALRQSWLALRDKPLRIDDTPALSMAQIAAIARREKAANGIGLLVIDYLQLIDGREEGDASRSRQEVVAQISRRLKGLARELDIPVLALSQINRDAEKREGHRPRLADLRESGAIEQDADMVLFVHRPETYKPGDKPGVAEIIIAKNRNGATGFVDLMFQKHMGKFESLSRETEPGTF